MNHRLRVVVWTTGKTGSAAVRGMVDHPALEIVGCYAYSQQKVGRDVGELCGGDPIGVRATDDIDALLALQPDCVVYTAFRPDFDHLVQILESGINVVTTMYMLAGNGYGDGPTARLRDAATRGGSSLYSSGIYPGHVAMVALAASAMCQRIDRLSILESLDVQGYANEQMFRAMGFDLESDDPGVAQRCEAACGSFKDQIGVLATALAADLDGVGFRVEVATANHDTDFGFMTLRKGRVAALRGTVFGHVGGRSVLECAFVWKLGQDSSPNWPVTDGYVVEIDGDPGVRCSLGPLDGHLDGATATAMPVVNAIRATCAAAPGIVNQADLPFLYAAHLVR